MIAEDYAKAVHALVAAHPEKQKDYLGQLFEALKRRGHIKLLPRILKAYELLELRNIRTTEHKKVTPEKEQNRVLLELYKKLVSST